MSDALRVQEGFCPWLPAAGVTAGEVLDHHDVPRTGLLHASGMTYLFDCILGDGRETGIWAYSHVTEAELKELLASSGPESFDEITSGLMKERWVTVAAVHDHRILHSMILDAGMGGVDELIDRFMKHIDKLAKSQEKMRELVVH